MKAFILRKEERRINLNKKSKDLHSKVDHIALAYVHARRRMIEAENGASDYPSNVINDSFKIVYHVDSVIESMDERAKLILENEVKLHKTGEWYREYCSSTTYYRIRNDIYLEFLSELEK